MNERDFEGTLVLEQLARIDQVEEFMAADSSFHDYVVHDLLGKVDGITSRAMFGGWALYRYRIIFGIIVDAELYLKVDETNRLEFERMGSHPFVYSNTRGRSVTMPYWLVTEEQMEDHQQLLVLLERSVAISRIQQE